MLYGLSSSFFSLSIQLRDRRDELISLIRFSFSLRETIEGRDLGDRDVARTQRRRRRSVVVAASITRVVVVVVVWEKLRSPTTTTTTTKEGGGIKKKC